MTQIQTSEAIIYLRRKAQRGLTIVELMVAMVVIGVFFAAARYGYNMIYAAKGQADVKLMEYAMECARDTYGNSSSYSAATIADLVNNGCFPSNLVTNKGTSSAYATNKYGSNITVAAVNVSGTKDGLQFTDPAIPSDICVDRLKRFTRPIQMTVTASGGSAVVVQAIGDASASISLATACGANTTATMTFTISKN